MAKIKLEDGAFGYPMPVTLVGSTVADKPNFMAVAWVSRVNRSPAYLAIAIGKKHHTTRGIEEHGTFSVNLPGRDLVVPTDYVGINSGAEVDKAAVFGVFYGELGTAPMVEDCQLCAEYRVVHKVELPGNNLYVGEQVAAYADEGILVDGEPHITKLVPFLLIAPPDDYVPLGAAFAQAWSVGKRYEERAK
jgi:flavin reductase (DIM6/NTAB) family NADH-FMN oxidoreductase RutF